MSKKLISPILIMSFLFLMSCNQNEDLNTKVEVKENVVDSIISEQPIKPKYANTHEYGGWSCPDNLYGFPPVDIKDLDKIPVVNGRLPTKEETQNGTSLIFFDPEKFPNARPLDMIMPKLARCYSEYTKKNELIIVIQAVVSDQDTVVGFRYLNGGNGSAWFGEVEFVSDTELEELGATPFVSLEVELGASKEKVWEVITNPIHATSLGGMFPANSFTELNWKAGSVVHFKNTPGNKAAMGIISALWGNLYIQVDYNFDGYHYVEKFLILEDQNTKKAKLKIVSGPYREDYEAKKTDWENWLKKVKELSN